MKKIIGFCLITFFMSAAFAQNIVYAPLYIADEENMLFHDGKEFYVYNWLNNNYAKLPEQYIKNTKEGYTIVTFPWNSDGEFNFTTRVLIPGENYTIGMYYQGNPGKRPDDFYEVVAGKKNSGLKSIAFYDKRVKVSSSSYLTEDVNGNKIEYKPENLFKFLDYLDHRISVNRFAIPWVEGKNDYGIGESITFEFKNEVNAFNVINGYVDPYNLNLYKNNSRVKKLKIENLATGKSWIEDFEDKIYINRIESESPSKSFKITIMDVYKGSKYKDTCITAIFSDPDWPKIAKKASTYFEEYINGGNLVSFEKLNEMPYIDPNDPVNGR